MSLERLLKKRNTLITKIKLQEVTAEINYSEAKVRLELLEKHYEDFEKQQEKIEEELTNADNNAPLEEQDKIETETMQLYVQIKSALQTVIDKKLENSNASTSGSVSASLDNVTAYPTPIRRHNIKMPDITLPKFDGKNVQEWPSFKDLFNSMVTKNESIKPSEKLIYLNRSLESHALDLIKHIDINDGNFEVAWKALEDRYSSKRRIVYRYLKAIIELQPAKTDLEVITLIDTANQNLRGLRNENTPENSNLLTYLIISKLPTRILKEWDRSLKNKDALPTYDELEEFLRWHVQYVDETPTNTNETTTEFTKRPFLRSDAAKPINQCSYCRAEHMITSCPKYLAQSIDDRWETVRKLNVCRNCLKGKHLTIECKSIARCNKCQKRHHVSLHQDLKPNNNNSNNNSQKFVKNGTKPNYPQKGTVAITQTSTKNEEENNDAVAQVLSVLNNNQEVVLPTAIAKVKMNNGTYTKARLILDSCSQLELVSERMAKLCQGHLIPSKIELTGVGNSNSSSNYKTSLTISNLDGTFEIEVRSAQVLPYVVRSPKPLSQSMLDEIQKQNIKLADSKLNTNEPIDILIGAKYFNKIITDGYLENFSNGISLRNTKFGWTIFGGDLSEALPNENSICCFTLSEQLERFWRQEEVITFKPQYTEEEQYCENLFAETTKFENGQFIVKLPFKSDINLTNHERLTNTNKKLEILGNNFTNVKQQLKSTERRLTDNPNLKEKYDNFMAEYINLGHMTPLLDQSQSYPAYYIPHHAVFKKDSEKIRVVFNASAPSDTETNLNDLLCKGPTIQPDLFEILLHFRNNKIALIADIEMMYRRVLIAEEDRCFQKVIWRAHFTEPYNQYQLTTVTYGTTPAPFLAVRCLEQIAREIEVKNPKLAEEIRQKFYMDDFTSGTNTVAEAINLKNDMKTTLGNYGFNLRKWTSNHLQLNDSDENYQSKILGVNWNLETDSITFRGPKLDNKVPDTKRKALAEMSRIFDPLGLIAPIIITAKIFIQTLWRLNVNWDDTLPLKEQNSYLNFRQTLPDLDQITVPRYTNFNPLTKLELHAFSDASEKAFAAVIYLRTIAENEKITCTILASKTRVAPNTKVSLPRLELCAASLAANLLNRISLQLNIPSSNCFGWSDSTITLSWLAKPPCSWKPYVANRVASIQNLLPPAQWRHIPGKQNPADIASRGISVKQLTDNALWWNGPSFLTKTMGMAPKVEFNEQANEEKRTKDAQVYLVVEQEDGFLNYSSSFLKLIRTIAYCRRFIKNVRNKTNQIKQTGMITVLEYQQALKVCIKYTQSMYFSAEINAILKDKSVSKQSPIKTLCPFLDEDGILHVGGRLANAEWSYNQKYPVILPSKGHFTKLLIEFEHTSNLHAPTEILLAKLRHHYWIVHGRATVKSILRRCVTCAKSHPQTSQQKMADLPLVRIKPERPFSHVGVDYAGPLSLKSSNLRRNVKTPAYIALFVCMKTKAVHIELVQSLSAEAFIAALRRFIARRGYPAEFYSDNGTNFTASNHILFKKLGEFLKSEELNNQIQSYLTPKQICWNFIPPGAPNFGGLWESNVKSVKRILRKVVGENALIYEELSTLLTQIEAVLNSRPISALSEDPSDMECLTPSHFLTGTPLLTIPERIMDDNRKLISRWHLVQQLMNQIWKRWTSEYVSTLQKRQKWEKASSNLKPGDLVLLQNDRNAPGHWSLGRVTEIFEGRDGLVRVAEVKTRCGTYRRPITKIALLPCN